MIEATCSACGTAIRVADGDVPPGAKFLTCQSCKARVALPAAAAAALPKIPPRPPAIPGVKRAELADLPAPKRPSSLAGLEAGKPAPKKGLDLADLPAPKSAAPSALPDLDLSWGADDGPADLPAPKPKSAPPAPPPRSNDILTALDLPAPKPRSAPRAGGPDLSDSTDLPAPKSKPSPPAFGAAMAVPVDLPAPKAPGGKPPAFKPTPSFDAGLDLPAPKPRASPLPTAANADAGDLDIIDLPAPKTSGLSDLPTPKSGPPTFAGPAPLEPLGIIDLPTPKGISDLPAPKPGANLDLPAPKGFFDDLPQPANPDRQPGSDLIAPKGFFDDLPQVAKAEHASPPSAGFFDDLPAPVPTATSPAGGGFFGDDLALSSNKATEPMISGVFDDLPEPDMRSAGQELDLELRGSGTPEPESKPESKPEPKPESKPEGALDLGALDLDLPTPSSDFADLDLSAPSAPSAKAGISIKASPPAAPPRAPDNTIEALPKIGGELRLELEGESPSAGPFQGIKEREPKKAPAAEVVAPAPTAKAKRKKLVLGGVAAAVALVVGGGLLYQRHTAQKERAAALAEHLQAAQAAIYSDHPDHWNRASTAAGAALQVDSSNVAAIGLRAEALIAGALDTGLDGQARIAQGQALLRDALSRNVTGPALEIGQALSQIATNQAGRSIAKLEEHLKREPKNGFLHLYLGWARAAMSEPLKAVASFNAAIAADPKTKLPAVYARGRAKLELLDLEGAKTDFAAVLEIAKDHIGAQVGLAAALPPSQASQREIDLLAVLARKDIASADPRAVVQAWTLAGEVARVGDRLDVARERYRQALAITKLDVPALVGLARVELRDGKLAVAADLVQKALSQRADDLEGMLVAAELAVRQGKIADATAITSQLANRVPPLLPLQRARLQLVVGQALEAQSRDAEAVDAWVEGAKMAGDLDLSPMMAAVTKLSMLAKKATDNHDEQKAADFRARADELLSSLVDRAQSDAYLSRTLGGAYLGAGDSVKAEQLLRRAVEIRATDIDSRLALAKALANLQRIDDAVGQLQAAQDLDATRLDISLELARILENAKRDADATEQYIKLIDQKDASLQARIHAGKYLARRGDFKRAAAQAELILEAEPENAAGHYLRGEGFLAANKLEEARKELAIAIDVDPDPQYLDAQGRIAEASVVSTGDTKYYDLALRAYERAIDADPTMINPQAGMGRVYVERKQWSKAAVPLAAAIKLDPNNTEVMYNLGVTYKNLGLVAEGTEWLELAIRNKPDPDAYWQLAQLYQDLNRGQRTANALRQATRLARDKEAAEGVKVQWLTEAWYRLGETELGLHNDAAARAAYETYVERNPPVGAQLTEARRLLSSSLRRQ